MRLIIGMIYVAIFLIALFLYNTFIEDRFKLTKSFYIVSTVISSLLIVFINALVPNITIYTSCIYHFLITYLIILTFTDIQHYEISSKSYYFILIPVLVKILIGRSIKVPIINIIMSFVVLFLLEKINYYISKSTNPKITEYETGLGGADIKLLLILSLILPKYSIFSFLIFTMFFGLMFYVLRSMIKRDFEDKKIPLIFGITCSFVLMLLY